MQFCMSSHHVQMRQPIFTKFIHKIDIGTCMLYVTSKIEYVGNSAGHALPIIIELLKNFVILKPIFKFLFAYKKVFYCRWIYFHFLSKHKMVEIIRNFHAHFHSKFVSYFTWRRWQGPNKLKLFLRKQQNSSWKVTKKEKILFFYIIIDL